MFPVMQSASRLNGYAFLLMLVVMFILSVPALLRFAQKETEAASLYLSGDLSRKFEKEYDSNFVLREKSIELWANLQYLAFGEGSSGVILGRDGWLFTSEEYLLSPDIDALEKESLERLKEVASRLQQKGKRLVMIPVPLKADIYAEATLQQPDSAALNSYTHLLVELSSNGIEVVDSRSALLAAKQEGLTFLKRDTHWSPLGARSVAAAVAKRYPDLQGEKTYVSSVVGQKEYPGDLCNFIRFSELFSPVLHAPEAIDMYETTQTNAAFDEDALFGDQSAYYALVGSSYTDIDDWNFVGFLKESLKHDIVPYALKAEGPWKAMENYLERLSSGDDDTAVVFWEFPVRVLLSRNNFPANWEARMAEMFASVAPSEGRQVAAKHQ